MTRQDAPLILSVISDPATRQELSELLAGTGFRLELSDTPDLGLAMAEAMLPDAILIDMHLPGNSALETCRRMRASRVLRGAPVLMLFSHDDRDARAAGLSAGADDFFDKPFDGLELLARLRTITRLSANRLLTADLTRFAWMAAHAPEGYLLLDSAGRIQYANESAHALLHLPDDPAGLPFVNVVERLYAPEPESVWQRWLDDPEPCFLVQPESPTARAAWLVLEALDSLMGAEHHRVVRLRDVTERMSIYHDMRRFHTVVSHKLRTPMSVMYTNLNLMSNRLEKLSPDEIRRFAAETVGGAFRLVSEIRDILAYIDAPLSLNYGDPLAVRELPDMVQSMSQTLKLSDVHLSLPAHLANETIAFTPYAMEMLLYELLENAQKFHPQRAPRVDISVGQTEPGYIKLRVVDDGVHLSPEQLRWVWLPYVQGEKDFTGELPGMGLGFPMAATLIWQAGGDLRLRNRPDAPGVVVDMDIPLEETSRQRQRSAARFGEE